MHIPLHTCISVNRVMILSVSDRTLHSFFLTSPNPNTRVCLFLKACLKVTEESTTLPVPWEEQGPFYEG